MKKTTSDTHQLVGKFETKHEFIISSSLPLPNLPNKKSEDEWLHDEPRARRSSLLSIPSSFSFTSTQQETPIGIPIRATSTTFQTEQRRQLFSQNRLCETPLVALLQTERNPLQKTVIRVDGMEGDLNESSIELNDTTLLLHSDSQCDQHLNINTHIESSCSQNNTQNTTRRSSSNSDDFCLARFEVLDKTINLHESLLHETCSQVEEEFLTEPFWSESQVERLKNYEDF